MIRLATIFAIALTATACGSEKTTTFETDEGEGSYTVDTSTGEAEGSIDTDEGTVNFRSGADVPLDLPKGFTLYPGAKVVSNTSVNRGEGKAAILAIKADDSPEEVVAFYRKQAKAAGVKIEMEMTANDSAMIGGQSEDGTSFMINASPDGQGGTTANMTLGAGLE